jgi:hypothetical protein
MNIFNFLFVLPHIINIFKKIKFDISNQPKKHTLRKLCKTNEDCMLPEFCCHHPVFPFEKECCSGFGHMIPQTNYQYNII